MEKYVLTCDYCNNPVEQARAIKIYETPILEHIKQTVKGSKGAKFIKKHICDECLFKKELLTINEMKHFAEVDTHISIKEGDELNDIKNS